MKRLLLLLCGILSVVIPAYSADGEIFTYTYKGQTLYYFVLSETKRTCIVFSHDKAVAGALELPAKAEYNGVSYSVTSIVKNAFRSCSSLTSVSIPKSVTSIGNYAFQGCTNLASVDLPGSVKEIGIYAFSKCISLASVEIPNSVQEIGEATFWECTSLTSVEIPNSVQTIGKGAFLDCISLTSVKIPNSVQAIGDGAFQGCTSLASVEIPNSVQEIGEATFLECTSLTSVDLPGSVKEIGIYAFSNCTSLTSVKIPNSVQAIGEGTFLECTSLTSVDLPGSVKEIGIYAFSNCTSLTSVKIPNSVQAIGEGTFLECTSLTSVKIPNSVQAIGDGAFLECTSLTSVEIPNSVKAIGMGAFMECTSLTSVVIPNSVTKIGDSAFSGCAGLTSVKVSSSTPPSASENTFSDKTYKQASLDVPEKYIMNYHDASPWNKFQNITADGACTKIYSDGVFRFQLIENEAHEATLISGNYSSLKEAIIPESFIDNSVPQTPTRYNVTSIASETFKNCTRLTEVVIPGSVTSIGTGAFSGCTGLKKGAYPNSVSNPFSTGIAVSYPAGKTIYEDGILYNSSKSALYYGSISLAGRFEMPKSVKGIGDNAFRGCSGLTSVIIPNSVTSIGESTFSGCSKLASVSIPNSVKTIGSSAFSGCSGLVSVILPPSLTSLGKSAFDGCTGLIKSIYPNSLTNPFSSGEAYSYKPNNNIVEDGCLFDAQKTSILFVSPGIKGEFTVPASVKTIGDNAFALCKDITYVRMPSTLSKIGNNAFKGCNLYDFTIPNSVKEFDMGTLAGNPLKSLTVGSGVTQITGTGYFSDSNLEKIFWLGNIPPVGYQGFNPVINFVSNDQYHFSNQVLYSFLSSIFEVGGIVYVPVSPSERTCNVVDYLYAPSNAKFSVPATIENKGIQMKVIDVGAYAFYHHDYLIDIILNNNGVIDDYAFYDCLKLQTVTFGKNIPAIKNHTFQNCEVLKKVENSPALMSIGKWAFSGCVGMEYFSVGKKIESFGEEAFSDCTGLTEFYSYAANPPVCGAQALDDIIKWNCTLYVPEGCESLYASAPQWKDFFYIKGVEDAGIESIRADVKTEVEIFDLNGIKQTRRMEDLPSGIYIVRQGSEVTKKVVK